MRKAEELSTTTAPWRTAIGAKCFEVALPAEKSAMSVPAKLPSVSSSTGSASPLNSSRFPAERGRGEEPEARHRKAPPLQAAQQLDADRAGGADDRD